MKAVRAEVRFRPFSPGVCLKIVAADVRRRTLAQECRKPPPPHVGGYGRNEFSNKVYYGNSRIVVTFCSRRLGTE